MKVWRCFLLTCLLLATLGSNAVFAQPGRMAPPEITISAVTPLGVYNDLDSTITITGSGFTSVTSVTLGTIQLVYTIVNDSTITATIPWGTDPGMYSVSVGNSYGTTTATSWLMIMLGVDQWINNGPYGGEVTQILQNPVVTDTLFVNVANIGIFKNTNLGDYWIFSFSSGSPIGNMAMDAADVDLLYATKNNEGVYRSLDSGNSWTAIPFPGISQIYAARVFAHPTIGDLVFAGLSYSNQEYECASACGIYRSANAGTTWTRVSADIPNIEKITAIAFGSGYILAGTESGKVYYSTNTGDNWAEAVVDWNGDTPATLHVSKLAIQPGDTRIFWLMEGEGYSGSMYDCAQSGMTVLSLSCEAVNIDGTEGSDPVTDIKFNPSNPADILVAGTKPARSTDNGATWTFYSAFSAPFQSEAVAFDSANASNIFAGNLQGFFTNTNAATYISDWTKITNGMSGLVPKYFAISPSEEQSVYVNTDGGGLFHSVNGGSSWTELAKFSDDGESQYTLRTPIAVDPMNDQNVIIANWYNSINISTDGGQTWTQSNALTPPSPYETYTFDFRFLQPFPGESGVYLAGGFFFDPSGGDLHEAPAGAIYKLEVTGTAVTYTNLYVNADLGRIQAVVFDPDDPSKIYCGSYTKDTNGYPAHSAIIYSTNGGTSWSYSVANLEGYQEVNTLTIRPSTGELLVNGGSNILKVDPAANEWTVFGNIAENNTPINALYYVPALGSTWETLFVATMQGLYETTNNGVSWSLVNSGFTGVNATTLGYAPIGTDQGVVYTGVAGGGLASASASPDDSKLAVSTQMMKSSLTDGGVYHLTRFYKDVYNFYIPVVTRPGN